MDPKLQSNFIPKGPAPHSMGTGVYTNRKESIGPSILGVLGAIIFVLTVLAAGGVFGYKLYLTSRIASMGTDLATARTTINPDQITELTDLNTRINATKQILQNHTVLSPLFAFLEANTVSGVAFTEMHYTNSGTGNITITLSGLANGYDDVALQSNIFNSSSSLQDPVFSDLKLNDKGQVTFTFSASVNPSLISYTAWVQSQNLGASSVPTVPTVPLPVATGTATTTKP
jgi:hypothetical protein